MNADPHETPAWVSKPPAPKKRKSRSKRQPLPPLPLPPMAVLETFKDGVECSVRFPFRPSEMILKALRRRGFEYHRGAFLGRRAMIETPQ